jgi:hypothetical protein
MKRTLVVVAAVVGFAAAASASTLTVATNHVTNLFNVGEQVILTVNGNAQGGVASGILGTLNYSAALTSFVSNSQTAMYPLLGPLASGPGSSDTFNQINGLASPSAPSTQTIVSTVTLNAVAPGVVNVTWNAASLDFFGTYGNPVPAGTSFTIVTVPEPATAALIGLGLIGLVLGGKRRA